MTVLYILVCCIGTASLLSHIADEFETTEEECVDDEQN